MTRLTAEQQFKLRAKKALETGDASFKPRGDANKALFQNMQEELDKKAKEINVHTSSVGDRIVKEIIPLVALFSGGDSTNPRDRINARLLQNAANNKANKADRELAREQKAAAKAKAKAKGKAKAEEPSAKRAKTSSSSSSYSSSSSSSDHAEDHIPTVEEVNNEDNVANAPPPYQDGHCAAEAKDKDDNLTLAHKNDSFMSNWVEGVLRRRHPRAVVDWSEYVQTTWGENYSRCNETLHAIIRVAQMLTEIEEQASRKCNGEGDCNGEEECNGVVDIRAYWARNFVLRSEDANRAMTIHGYDTDDAMTTHELRRVRLSKSSV